MSSPNSRPSMPRAQSFVNWGEDAVRHYEPDAPAADHYDHKQPTSPSSNYDFPIDTPAQVDDYDAIRAPPSAARRVPRVSQMPAYPSPAFPPPTYTRPGVQRSTSAESGPSPPWKPQSAPRQQPTKPLARSYSQVESGGRAPSPNHIAGGTGFGTGGILSSMLALAALRRSHSSGSNTNTSAPTSAAPSRAGSTYDNLPTYNSLGLRRTLSTASATTEPDGLEPDHPVVTGKTTRRKDWFSAHEKRIRDTLTEKEEELNSGEARKLERKAIQYHMSSVKARETFMLKLGKALLSYGFPPHKLEPTLDTVAECFQIDATVSLFSKRVQIVFEDSATGTSVTRVIKSSPALNLGKLHDTHMVYRDVMHDDIGVEEGTKRLVKILTAPDNFGMWGKAVLVLLSGMAICPAFGGSFIDSLVASVPGASIFLLQQWIAAKNNNLKSIANILSAVLGAFYARGLSSTGLFCYEAIASASIVFILPAFPALCGALELLHDNWDRAVASIGYAVLYVVVLGMGLSIGSNLYYDVDSWAAQAQSALMTSLNQQMTLEGSFTVDNGTSPAFTGSFTFSNGTSTMSTMSSLDSGNVACSRDPTWPWYRQSINQWSWTWVIYIPIFSLLLSLLNGQPLRKKQTVLMVLIAVLGQLANLAANKYLLQQTYVVNVVGPFVLGLASIICGRMSHGRQTALTLMLPGVLVSIPGGIAAAGGLAMSEDPGSSSYATTSLEIGGRMISVCTGISLGLILAAAVGYFINLHKKRTAIFAF